MLMSNVQNYCRALLFLGGAILFSLSAVAPAAPDTVSTAPMKSLRSITPLPPNAFDEGTCEGSEELFDHEVGLLKSNKLVSFDLNKIWQIETNSFNWSGEKDCSLVCDIGFTPNAVVGDGELKDDTPFMRALTNPRLPAGSEPPYAADAIEFVFEDTTSATRSVRVFLDFGPAGTRPRLIMTDTFSTMKKGCLTEAMLRVTAPSANNPATRFEFVIPYEEMCDPRFFNIPLRVSCIVHDIDGPINTYLRMKQTRDKK